MYKIVGFVISFFVLTTTTTKLDAYSTVANLYSTILGSKPVSEPYRTLTYKALADLGINNPEKNVRVCQMNGVGPAFARLELSSFTAFGIWLDEQYLNQCSEAEKMFHIYHEAAHYKLNHHVKVLTRCGLASLGSIAGLVALSVGLKKQPSWIRVSAGITTGLIGLYAGYRYLLPSLVKEQEKEADLLAAKTLCTRGRSDVVTHHIISLGHYPSPTKQDLWWYSPAEQQAYLSQINI